MSLIISYDLGTGGCKATLFDEDGEQLASSFQSYETYYPRAHQHEQRPEDWWGAVLSSTRRLLDSSDANPDAIRCLAVSGQSLAVVPLDGSGQLMREFVPIWSDTRPVEQAHHFFEKVDQDDWYMRTGNGFSRETYSVFKIMWYRDNEPEMFDRVDTIFGSKDYINYRLTGQVCTDHSYASGSGIYDLERGAYRRSYLKASGLPADIFPEIVEATSSLGRLTSAAAEETGLNPQTEVFCGGVDNSCMALGAGNYREGAIYLSLGSSAWLAVSSETPVVDLNVRPFVFAHVIPGMFTSATSIFSAGSSLKWLRDTICQDLVALAKQEDLEVYDLMVEAAMQSPPGANRLLFNPSLAGGPAAYPNPEIRGAFLGIELRHQRSDLIRAVLEGVALDLRIMYDKLAELVELEDSLLMVGGGSNSRDWRQMFANVFNRKFVKANIGQDAASLGAAAVAAVGAGIWDDYREVENIIEIRHVAEPDPKSVRSYEHLLPVYRESWQVLSDAAEILRGL